MKKYPIRLWRDLFGELAWLIRHGIALNAALSVLLKQRRLSPLHPFLYHCIDRMSQGHLLSTVFRVSPQSSLFQAFLICGERSGALEQSLQQCTTWLTQTLQFQTQCRALLFYPLLLCIVLLGGSILLVGVIVPQFHSLYLSLNAPEPLTMTWLWGTHVFMRDHGLMCLCMLLLCVAAPFIIYRLFPHVLLRLPFMRTLCHAHECAHLGTLLNGGIPLYESLHIVFDHARFTTHQHVLCRLMEAVSEGACLSVAYRQVDWHDEYLCDMLTIAEHTGTLAACYAKCYAYYDEQLDSGLKRLKQEWQPLILLGVGLLISVWVLLLYYPLIQLGYVVG